MKNINGIEQEIRRKKNYIEIQERNITKHNSYIERYKSEIEEIDKCKTLKELRDYNNSYAYNWEKYICYEIWEWGLDGIYEYDTFEKLKDSAKWYYIMQIENSKKEIRNSNELITKIKEDIHKLKKIFIDTLDEIYADDEK